MNFTISGPSPSAGFKDRNGVITQTIYNDPFDRPKQIKAALGTTAQNHTAMYYAPQTNLWGIALTSNDVRTARDQDPISLMILVS